MIAPFLLLAAATASPTAPAPAAALAGATVPASAPHVSRPLRLAFDSSSAFGVTHAKFFNQLAGVRIDYRFTSRFAFGGRLAYANLKGKDSRVHNVLPEVISQYRAPLERDRIGMTLHLALGFLPKNGPTLRLGAGVDFALSEAVFLQLVPLEPMLWVNRERPEVSLNASLSLGVAF